MYVYIYKTFFSRFFFIIDYYKILNIVPVLYGKSLLFILYRVVCIGLCRYLKQARINQILVNNEKNQPRPLG